ncbi:hypothetical protein DUNSADRAFT_2784 [Dunaliella salina]|uniref:FBD domain-containing protein n=1 Tax=Dunaliella salina TaxID=3046 RepID=A0ABQ7FW04_DUNSA|nr:hypothetical protein DUNSADRAFT_2784 [Dunaliella salina]|eukprot:KAF5826544.1 hypothetical protein DUNSADRAFT_2784 [Dunaliella salina]
MDACCEGKFQDQGMEVPGRLFKIPAWVFPDGTKAVLMSGGGLGVMLNFGCLSLKMLQIDELTRAQAHTCLLGNILRPGFGSDCTLHVDSLIALAKYALQRCDPMKRSRSWFVPYFGRLRFQFNIHRPYPCKICITATFFFSFLWRIRLVKHTFYACGDVPKFCVIFNFRDSSLHEHIDDPHTRRALFHATRAVRFESFVLSKYPQKLCIKLPIPHTKGEIAVLNFPRGAHLCKLTIFGWGGLPNDAIHLPSIFSSKASVSLQNVETLVLQFFDLEEFSFKAQEEEDNGAAVGAALRASCPNLRILELQGPFLSLGLLKALEGCMTLTELHVYESDLVPSEFLVSSLSEMVVMSISTMHNLRRLTFPDAESYSPLRSLKQLQWLSVVKPLADDFSEFLQGCPFLDFLVVREAPSLPVSSPYLKFLRVSSDMSMHDLMFFVASANLPSLVYLKIDFLYMSPYSGVMVAAARSQLAAMPGVMLEVSGLGACQMTGSQIIDLLDPFANKICARGSYGIDVHFSKVA